jgi:nucleoside 2-deoxyribosyltransferase
MIKVYLASAYSSNSKWKWIRRWERYKRFKKANKIAGLAMEAGFIVFSPISHSHPIAKTLPESKNTYKFWLPQDYSFLKECDVMWIIDSSPWKRSRGVCSEIKFCFNNNIPVSLLLSHFYFEELTKNKFNEIMKGVKYD